MYSQTLFSGCLQPNKAAAFDEEDMGAAAAVHAEYLVTRRCEISRIMFYVTVLVAATTTAPTLTFRRRLIYASASGQSTLGVLTIPDTTAVGKVIYKDITPVVLNVGDTITLDHTQITVGGGAAGKGIYGFEVHPVSEDYRNESDLVASA